MFNIFKKKRKVLVYDLAYLPDGWSIDNLMDTYKKGNLIIYDSFKEGKSGAATGKLAGNFNIKAPYVVEI